MRKIIFFIFLPFLISCSPHKPDHMNDSSTLKEMVKSNSDTLYVTGKGVTFFTITNAEYDSLAKSAKDSSEINEVLSDFNYYSGIVIESLTKQGIKCTLTSKPIIKIIDNSGNSTIYNRSSKKHMVGLILTNGKSEPTYYYGVTTDVDMFGLVDKYFNEDR